MVVRVILLERLDPFLTIIGGYSYNEFIMDLTPLLDQGFEFSTKTPGLNYRFIGTISKDASALYELFANYLGARICVFSDEGDLVWDGLLWETELTIGNNSLGPLTMDWVANYCAVEYSDVLDSNRYALSTYQEDGASFDLFGLIEKILPYGQFTSVAAANAAGRYEANHSVPRLGGNIALPVTGNDLKLRITAVGYWATAGYIKIQSILTTSVTVQNRIKEIVDRTVTRPITISGTPQNYPYLEFFSTDVSLIEGTNLTIIRYTTHVEATSAYFERMVSLGDTSFNTWYVGAEVGSFDGKFPVGYPRVKVWQRPTAVEFFASSQNKAIYDSAGVEVSPFRVRAGNSVQVNGLIPAAFVPQIPIIGDNTFIVQESRYDSRTWTLSVTPEGGDEDVSIIIASMSG